MFQIRTERVVVLFVAIISTAIILLLLFLNRPLKFRWKEREIREEGFELVLDQVKCGLVTINTAGGLQTHADKKHNCILDLVRYVLVGERGREREKERRF